MPPIAIDCSIDGVSRYWWMGTTMRDAGDRREGATARIASIVLKLLRLGYLACRLGMLETLLYCLPHVPTVLRRAALLGAVLCFAFEFVLGVTGFPFWSAMSVPGVFAALLLMCRAVGIRESSAD